jgi:hypothetical protein
MIIARRNVINLFPVVAASLASIDHPLGSIDGIHIRCRPSE